MIGFTLDTKPEPWGLLPGAVLDDHRDLWRNCRLAIPFWNVSGRRADDVSGHRLHATFDSSKGLEDWVSTPYGHGILFDNSPSTDKLVVTDPPTDLLDNTSKLSLAVLWLTDAIPADRQRLISKYNTSTGERSWRVYLRQSDVELQLSDDGVGFEDEQTTGAAVAVDTWYRMIMTWDAGTWRCWLNGKEQATTNFTTTSIFGGTHDLWIGRSTDSLGWIGQIADVRLWIDRVLNPTEVELIDRNYWGMYERGPMFPSGALEHSGGQAAGPWQFFGSVPAGVEAGLITGLTNGISYDVRADTVDTSMNTTTGTATPSATPAAGSASAAQARRILHGPQQVPPLVRRSR